ncbi:hypothetical protein KBZ33_18460 [Cyanobium sp. Cruz-8D1]|nr:hypothetical protein [Cyanobium sp. Cruz-8H5]MCP9868251.1 hypothetical protein [Cyanobium sp. Cruz-8D1]
MVRPQVAPPTRTRCRQGGDRSPNRCQSGRAYGAPCPTKARPWPTSPAPPSCWPPCSSGCGMHGSSRRIWARCVSASAAATRCPISCRRSSEHPAVDLVGVIGIQDPVHGENVRAYLTLRPDQPAPSEAELIAFARARVGYKAPEEIRVLEQLPLTPVGKTDRLALRQLAADGLHDA